MKALVGGFILLLVSGIAVLAGHPVKKAIEQQPSVQRQTPPRKQDLATVSQPVGITFTPKTQTIPVGQLFHVRLMMDSNTLSATGIDMTLPIDTSTTEFVSFSEAKTFNTPLINSFNKNDSILRFSAVSTSRSSLHGEIPLGELTLKAKKVGKGILSPSSIQLTASGYDKAIPSAITPGEYTIQ